MKTFQIIKTDPIKRGMYLDGFSHGNIGIKKQLPSYEKESYNLGFKDGSEGRIDLYLEMIKENEKGVKVDKKPYTRMKKK